MRPYLVQHPWKIIEDGFHPEHNRITESVMSLGNGKMGQRAVFEETYSGETLQGSYIAGIYYPDPTKVGWWKNGYPEYFAKVLNSVNWIGLRIIVDGEELDLHECEVLEFHRELDMKEGLLRRNCRVRTSGGADLRIESTRFYSLSMDETCALQYAVTPLHGDCRVEVESYLDFDVINEDSNYDEKFWDEVDRSTSPGHFQVTARTKKLDFRVCASARTLYRQAGEEVVPEREFHQREKYVSEMAGFDMKKDTSLQLQKICSIVSNFYYDKGDLQERGIRVLGQAIEAGFDGLYRAQVEAWATKWEDHDIEIKGDVAAQQGIRFNIFQLNQTYTGRDPRLNIGPKGFTGEKYGGSTYWDTEAYCIPFYMATADPKVARNLLLYRYKHLQKAIENAEKLGFSDGAALYPMVTMNGEECHNEWEITFEEIHRNGAIAYAIFDYVRYTGDWSYVPDYGIDVLIAICRFWAQRFTWSAHKDRYVMLGVTGPNEYENNVNNNWYTIYIGRWCFRYTMECIGRCKDEDDGSWDGIASRNRFREKELEKWKEILEKAYIPKDESRGIFLQQDGFLDKELIPADELPKDQRPINKHWSWDRILRSVYIKQADVLQGMYFFSHEFDPETIRRNYDFYEPFTVHESSLSPCVHVILASMLGYREQAYRFYLRTARLDLDDYNADTDEGCHITSMGGTWMALIKGFGGFRVDNGSFSIRPVVPDRWEAFSFKVKYRGARVYIRVYKDRICLDNQSDTDLDIRVYDETVHLAGRSSAECPVRPFVTGASNS